MADDKQIWMNTLSRLKAKCKQDTIPFSLTIGDIAKMDHPVLCEYTGLTLSRQANTGGNPSTPTLVPIDKAKGYVAENVKIVSNLAATLLTTLSPDQLNVLAERLTPVKPTALPSIEQLDDVVAHVFADATAKQCQQVLDIFETHYTSRMLALKAIKQAARNAA